MLADCKLWGGLLIKNFRLRIDLIGTQERVKHGLVPVMVYWHSLGGKLKKLSEGALSNGFRVYQESSPSRLKEVHLNPCCIGLKNSRCGNAARLSPPRSARSPRAPSRKSQSCSCGAPLYLQEEGEI